MSTSPEEYQPPREIEKRAFEVEGDKLRAILKELGARSLGVLEFKRAVLDVNPLNPNKWIRVRTDGKVTTLAVKERISSEADGTSETELETEDFDKTLDILLALQGLRPRSIQENRRDLYQLAEAEVSIDTWPLIGDVLEIEALNEAVITEAAEKLGIEKSALTGMTVEQYYLEKLGVDVKTIPHLRFNSDHNPTLVE